MMLKRAFKCVGLASLLATPSVAQFGVNKKGGTFEELNEMAKNAVGADGVMDLASVQQRMKDAMNDPQFLESMGGMADGMGDMMAQLQNMDSSELMAQMQEGLKMLTNPDMLNTIMGQKEEVFASLKAQGLVDDETLQKYEAALAEMFAGEEMQEVLRDPEKIREQVKIGQGMPLNGDNFGMGEL